MKLIKFIFKLPYNILLKYARKDFIKLSLPEQDKFDFENTPKLFPKSFGDKNPDKVFYIIWRENGGAGFFSNLTHVFTHIKIATDLGMIPVVDFENFKTFYNEESPVNNSNNSWEYYFKQISPYSLAEVYSSKNVFFCDGTFQTNAWVKYFTDNDRFKLLFNQYINLNKNVEKRVNDYSFIFNERVLGVHFRGKEMNYAPHHPFAPTIKQMFKYTDIILTKFKIDKIFLVTEEKDYQDAFIMRYQDKVIYTDSFCIAKVNAYNLYPRAEHRYLLGFEVLCDALLLSKCNVLLYNESNVSYFAEMIGNHEAAYCIDNGKNSSNPILARYIYLLKKRLPPILGGLKNSVRIKTRKNL